MKEFDKVKFKLATVMAVADADQPEDTPIRIRGMVRNFGAPASRGFLQVASPPGDAPSISKEASGRLELARWITAPENPRTESRKLSASSFLRRA